jgi:hypothetical protein
VKPVECENAGFTPQVEGATQLQIGAQWATAYKARTGANVQAISRLYAKEPNGSGDQL